MDKVTRERHAKVLAHKIIAAAVQRAVFDMRRAGTEATADGEPDERLKAEIVAQLEEQMKMHDGQTRVFQSTFDRHARDGKPIADVAITFPPEAVGWETFGGELIGGAKR